MQIGEPVSVAPPAVTPPDTELVAELVSFTFKSPVTTSRAKATITGPHWERGQEGEIEDRWSRHAKKMRLPAEPYSKRAAVYLVKGSGSGSHQVEVAVRVTRSQNVSGDARLVGKLWGLSIEGACPTSVGEHTVVATITEPPEEIRGYRGKIAWRLWVDSAGITVDLGSSLAELYFILGTPSLPYKAVGVWAEALRFLCGRVGVAGESDGKSVAARVTAYCHGEHGLRYETKRGKAQYGVSNNGGVFDLENYLLKTNPLCNCFDQAAAVQALVGAVGVTLAWLYLRPFGYIKPTNLVGVGLCNNPFFDSNRSEPLVDPASSERTGFGSHAFVGCFDGTILDACAKPHLGTETTPQFLADSIDDSPSLYRGDFLPGRLKDVRPKIGIIAVD